MNRFSFVLLVLGLFVLPSYGSHDTHKDSLVKWNRTPKEASIFQNACDECQIIVKRIVQIAKDPSKLGELKMLLSLLCKETSYEEECRLFVSNIDRFLEKLLPYLKDAHSACQKLHICGNTQLEQFHRVGLLYAKKYLNKLDGAHDLICEECQFAAHELLDMVDDRAYQQQVKQFLSEHVCAHIGSYQGTCDAALDSFLPDFFTELHDLLSDNKRFCVQIELCQPTERLTTTADQSETQEPSEQRKVSKRILNHFLKN